MEPQNSWNEEKHQQWTKTRQQGERRYVIVLCGPIVLMLLSITAGSLVWGEARLLRAGASLMGIALGLALIVPHARWRWRQNEALFANHARQPAEGRS